jgi:hypothetical protein
LSYAGVPLKGSLTTESWLLQAFYTGGVLVEGSQLMLQLNELDRVLDFLERMNLLTRPTYPPTAPRYFKRQG